MGVATRGRAPAAPTRRRGLPFFLPGLVWQVDRLPASWLA